jgi:hypothetical protein
VYSLHDFTPSTNKICRVQRKIFTFTELYLPVLATPHAHTS